MIEIGGVSMTYAICSYQVAVQMPLYVTQVSFTVSVVHVLLFIHIFMQCEYVSDDPVPICCCPVGWEGKGICLEGNDRVGSQINSQWLSFLLIFRFSFLFIYYVYSLMNDLVTASIFPFLLMDVPSNIVPFHTASF